MLGGYLLLRAVGGSLSDGGDCTNAYKFAVARPSSKACKVRHAQSHRKKEP